MYPKNSASPPQIAIGPVIQISDGAVQTSGCTVRIIPIGVAEGDGAGTTAYSTDGIVLYTPTQAETNYSSFILIAKKAGCIPVSITIITTATATPGTVVVTTNNDKTGYGLADDAITAAKFDESTAFPVKSADTGATQIARTGADADTLETLSDQLDIISLAAIADAVWDELIAGHAGVGSTGAALAAAGGSGDPWATALPGAYGAGTAGKIIGDNINAPIGTVDTVVDGLAAKIIGTLAAGTHNPQSGDAYARLGAPSGASVSADIAAVKLQTTAIETDTQDLQTQVGVDGAGLTSIGDARLANLDATISSRTKPADTQAAVTTVTNLANAPSAGDFTAVMKASLNAATPSVSVGVGGIPSTAFAAGAIDAAALAADAGTEIGAAVWASAVRSLTSAASFQVKKNTQLTAFPFVMTDALTHAPLAALAVTAERSLDGAAFGACANAVSEIGNGWYKITLAAADVNANTVALRFSAVGADDLNLTVLTQS